MAAKTETGLPIIVGKAYDFSLWLIQKVEHFPRSYRFSVGDRLVTGVPPSNIQRAPALW
jgi:hypothetical protein